MIKYFFDPDRTGPREPGSCCHCYRLPDATVCNSFPLLRQVAPGTDLRRRIKCFTEMWCLTAVEHCASIPSGPPGLGWLAACTSMGASIECDMTRTPFRALERSIVYPSFLAACLPASLFLSTPLLGLSPSPSPPPSHSLSVHICKPARLRVVQVMHTLA